MKLTNLNLSNGMLFITTFNKKLVLKDRDLLEPVSKKVKYKITDDTKINETGFVSDIYDCDYDKNINICISKILYSEIKDKDKHLNINPFTTYFVRDITPDKTKLSFFILMYLEKDKNLNNTDPIFSLSFNKDLYIKLKIRKRFDYLSVRTIQKLENNLIK